MIPVRSEGPEGGEYIQQDDSSAFDAPPSTTSVLCCGICDMRIATFAANGFNVATIVLTVLIAPLVASNSDGGSFWKTLGTALASGIPGLVLSGIGCYGAQKFRAEALCAAALGFFVCLVVDASLHRWVRFVVSSVAFFPHAVLALEMRNGSITEEHYHDKQQYVSPEGLEFVERMQNRFLSPIA